jgi:biotin operon repressor
MNSSEETPTRQWTGTWIPREIWESQTLTWMQKCLWAEIKNLSGKVPCWASNGYLADKMGSSVSSIANMISELRQAGLIVDVSFDGRRREILAIYKQGLTHGTSQGSPSGECRTNPQVNQDKRVEKSREEYITPSGVESANELKLAAEEAQKPKKPDRPRNQLIDLLVFAESGKTDNVQKSAYGRAARALADIRSADPDVSEIEIKRRMANYRALYRVSFTALGLAANWAKCDRGATHHEQVRIGL